MSVLNLVLGNFTGCPSSCTVKNSEWLSFAQTIKVFRDPQFLLTKHKMLTLWRVKTALYYTATILYYFLYLLYIYNFYIMDCVHICLKIKKKKNPCKNQYSCFFCFLFLLQELIQWVARAVDGAIGSSETIVSGHPPWLSPASSQGPPAARPPLSPPHFQGQHHSGPCPVEARENTVVAWKLIALC